MQLNSFERQTIPKGEVVCREGDMTFDLSYIISGKFMICSRSGHMVTPIAYIGGGEYFGEMSFIDSRTRSADVIAVEETVIIQIPQAALKKQFPTWLLLMTKQMTERLRTMNSVVRDRGIKRKNVKSVKPLTIDEQRYYYDLITNS